MGLFEGLQHDIPKNVRDAVEELSKVKLSGLGENVAILLIDVPSLFFFSPET